MKGKQQDFRTEKYIRYGIRKYSFGAASVAIAAGLMFLGNGAVSATEQNPVSDSKENIQKVENPSPELGESNIQLVEKTTETLKKEEVKVNKSLLEASISNLETALSNAKHADSSVVANVREALATAKAVLANETAKQEEVNIQKDILSSLKIVLTESNKLGLEKEQADKDKVAKEEAERKATPTEKALSEAKSALDKVSSEADVTNTLAATELRKKEVAPENRAAIEAAVAKNQAVLNESKVLLADKSITKEQVDAQLTRLNESILAVYSELKKAGIGRDGKFAVALAAQDFYAEGSTSTIHASEINATIHTGSDTYTIPHQEITLTKGAGTDTSGLEVVVYSNQRDGDQQNAGNGMHTEQGGATGHNNKGRVDYPLTPEAAKKLAEEAPLWRNKLRADGSRISNAATAIYSANGGYEYLATEIYRYGYEQGIDRVYIKGLKDRIAVTEAAKQAG
ncbi:YSIRK-type signal peptide-containing protein [Streptococcus pseudopneumoniae]|uniref:YSIRK-type signal peptide-containing protein n=1 Tax=Streptococcus pseudopneumoniae TaxID=257758 RepID=UPI00069DFB1C